MYEKITEKVAATIIKRTFRLVNENREPKVQTEDYYLIKKSLYTLFVYLLFSVAFLGFGIFTIFDGTWEGSELILSYLISLIGLYLLWAAYFSFSNGSDIEWDGSSIQGKQHLFPLPFRNNRCEISWEDVVFVGTKLDCWYVQSVFGKRVYWDFMHIGHGYLNDDIKKFAPKFRRNTDINFEALFG